jgi:hypothetical protein
MSPHDYRVRVYLMAVSALCREVADKPWLLPLFIEIVLLVPRTIMELRREERRLAA